MNVLRKLSQNGRIAKVLKDLYDNGKIKVLSPEESDKINRDISAEIEKSKDNYFRLCIENNKKFR